ncbi:hypothetical protein FIBSPDRAFT_532569 [Athelia psychrophila]|uniref:Uncharacterized protein n=1 Tax=Athelia psychrophila TaxID=1759441 RepID=A0A167VMC0_9AGAM|nr:hypothetical protein FIBSPDRAFT_361068 [Fibularhizoctonia sp. CBS 109695]KZP20638.1 hypothetical protein FIBSPDRAFT_532569 [Fibularhizoctonia sp. CBS 109695]
MCASNRALNAGADGSSSGVEDSEHCAKYLVIPCAASWSNALSSDSMVGCCQSGQWLSREEPDRL